MVVTLFSAEKTDKNFLEILVVYSFSVTDLSEKNISESIESIPKPIKDKVMTTYDRIMNEGIEKGIEKGVSKQRTEIILTLYDDGIGIPQISRYTKITEEEALKVLKENGRVE